jgi:hypothetical protein
MSELPDPPPAEPSAFHKDRREGGGLPLHPDDDQLAELTEEERVDAGIDPYEPDEVPPATDDPVPTDVTESEQYQEERAEIDREKAEGELPEERGPFPPTRYDE